MPAWALMSFQERTPCGALREYRGSPRRSYSMKPCAAALSAGASKNGALFRPIKGWSVVLPEGAHARPHWAPLLSVALSRPGISLPSLLAFRGP